MLETPEQIRELQRKLYQKAKQEPKFRFYLLYDKVYRLDILGHAYDLVRANKGAAGVDGLTFERIEETGGGAQEYLENLAKELRAKMYKPMPVRRVYIPKADGGKRPLGIPTIKDRIVQMATKLVIEPIFEADFQENSYGFRPKRNAHQAMEDISLHLRKGKTQVIDADISKYFDSIPHDKLLKEVAKRIVDKHILRLIKMWLTAPVVEEEDGKKRYTDNDKGTPQGGVISPLLANIYLNILDTLWKTKRIQEIYGARLIRYADDFVVLCRGNTERVKQGIETVLTHLGLNLNEQKTKVVNAREASFDFLSFTVKVVRSPRTGGLFPLISPSKKAINQVKASIKSYTTRAYLPIPTENTIKNLNSVVRGWTNYFYYRNCGNQVATVRNFLESRVRKYLRRKRNKNGWGLKEYPYHYLYKQLGLYKIPTTTPWKTTPAKAFGGR
jgi:group II intron reverse transcriptase/maturase